MKMCEKCGGEYIDEAEICIDCHENLVPVLSTQSDAEGNNPPATLWSLYWLFYSLLEKISDRQKRKKLAKKVLLCSIAMFIIAVLLSFVGGWSMVDLSSIVSNISQFLIAISAIVILVTPSSTQADIEGNKPSATLWSFILYWIFFSLILLPVIMTLFILPLIQLGLSPHIWELLSLIYTNSLLTYMYGILFAILVNYYFVKFYSRKRTITVQFRKTAMYVTLALNLLVTAYMLAIPSEIAIVTNGVWINAVKTVIRIFIPWLLLLKFLKSKNTLNEDFEKAFNR